MSFSKFTTMLAVLALAVPAIAVQQSQTAPAYTADKHKAVGLECAACHGEGQKKEPVEQTACLKCHESMQEVAKRTANIKPNPHDNHMSDQAECTRCHHGHRSDDLMCSECHQVNFERKK